MSHSVVKDTPTATDNTLVIVVGQDGSISVDQEILDSLIRSQTDVSVLRVDEDQGSTVDMTLETYEHIDEMDESMMKTEEVQRNYHNFCMDHCYTPLTSPSQRHPSPSYDSHDPDLEMDDLAQTLSLLEGNDKPAVQQQIGVKVQTVKMPTKVVQKDKHNHQSEKVNVTYKINKPGVNKVYKGVRTVFNKTQKVIKKVQEESEESDDNFNDSDYEMNGSPKSKFIKRTNKRRPTHEDKPKALKVRKGVKSIGFKPIQPKQEILPKPEPIPEPVKAVEAKKQPPKKEKKPPKPIDDGIALFSTPDIIRRVSDKPKDKPESPESPKTPKPAKIEDRSRSDSARTSIDSKQKFPQRLSLDSKLSPEKKHEKIEERRNSENKKELSSLESLLYQNDNIVAPIEQNSVFNNMQENQIKPLEPVVPTIEEINAIIHTNEPTPTATLNTEPNIGLETPLDIDHAILENINTDELISEDILYQVAKLVENPDLQHAIDKTLVDGSLALDPTLQQIQTQPPLQEPVQPQQTIVQGVQQAVVPTTPQLKTPQPQPRQVIRSDGRVLVLPPIEKPATRSSKKKQDVDTIPGTPHVQRPQPPQKVHIQHPIQQHAPKQHITPQLKVPHALPEEPDLEMGHSDIESDSDESWNSEDDPDRLWCICKQPHNNRFMICCDTCEDWFHGKCVNVTKAMGQQMEAQGKEWMCPNCIKKQNEDEPPVLVPAVSPPAASRSPGRVDLSNRRKSTDGSTPACIVCGAPSRSSSVYCSDQCILKHAQGVEKETKQTVKAPSQRIIVFERATGKCLSGINAPSAANLKQWLKEHPGFEVVRPANKGMAQSKLQFVRNPSGKGVALAVNKKGIQVGVLPHSPKPVTQIKLIPPTKLNIPGMKTQTKNANQTPPKTKLVQTTLKSPTNTTPGKPKFPPSSKLDKSLQKIPKKPDTPAPVDKTKAQENIRDNVKKTLFEQLMARLKEAEDLTLAEEEVNKMATEIELQLFKCFGDAGPKYRTKYRSLIFNIKDTKNHTLWRRICDKAIAPAQLVRLSPDDLASQELARWRERETKHQLDMIKKSELEMLSLNRTYVLKTHKGEQVMEDRINKVDSADIMPGLGADSTSEEQEKEKEKTDKDDHDRRDRKHSKRDRERRGSKDRRSGSKERKGSREHSERKEGKRKRSRSRDRDRSSHRSDRKRSRSRDRHHRSSHKSSRHKRDRHAIDYLDKKSKEILDNLENNKIVAPPEDRLWKHVPQQDIQVATPVDSDSDHEPTSTVTIPTPPRCTDQEEQQPIQPIEVKTEIKVETPKPRVDPRISRNLEPKAESPEIKEEEKESTPPLETKITSLSKETIVWEGNINMIDVAKFFITLHEVSGDCGGIGTELPPTLEIVGRISPDTVWEYIGKMRRSNSKMISILRLTAANMEEKMPYIALYSYLSSRNRLGVIKSTNNAVKDFYILPLASNAPVPQALLPISGPGFEDSRPHLLLGIVVRAKRKRSSTMDIITAGSATKRTRVETPPPQVPVAVPPPVPTRSYTPPPTQRDPRIKLPTVPPVLPATETTNDEDEPYSPEDSDPESGPVIPDKRPVKPVVPDLTAILNSSSTGSLSTTDISTMLNSSMKTSSFLDGGASALPSFEPFSNKFDGIPGLDVDTGVDSLQRKMEELDKCIEKQKEEIRSISQNIVSSGAAASMATNLSSINLPSNLQQILDSIKNIPSTANLDSQDASQTEEYCPTAPGYKSASSEELTIPLLLPKLNSRTQLGSRTQTPPEVPPLMPLQLPVAPKEPELPLPNLTIPPPPLNTLPIPNLTQPQSSTTIPLNLPKNKPKLSPESNNLSPPGTTPVIIPSPPEKTEPKSVLSTLSEEELIRKANEMLGEAETNREETPEPENTAKPAKEESYIMQKAAFKSAPVMYNTQPIPKRQKIDISQPPIPGLEEDEY